MRQHAPASQQRRPGGCSGLSPGNGMETLVPLIWMKRYASPLQRPQPRQRDGNHGNFQSCYQAATSCSGLSPGNGMETALQHALERFMHRVAAASAPATGWKRSIVDEQPCGCAVLQRPQPRQRDGNTPAAARCPKVGGVAAASAPATGWKRAARAGGGAHNGVVAAASAPATGWKHYAVFGLPRQPLSCSGLSPGNGMETAVMSIKSGSGKTLQRPQPRQRDGNPRQRGWRVFVQTVAAASAPATGWKPTRRGAGVDARVRCSGLSPGNGMETHLASSPRHNNSRVAAASAPATGWKLYAAKVDLRAKARLQRPQPRQRDGNSTATPRC